MVGDESRDPELRALFGVFVGWGLGSGTKLGGAEEGVVGDDELGRGEGVVGGYGHDGEADEKCGEVGRW